MTMPPGDSGGTGPSRRSGSVARRSVERITGGADGPGRRRVRDLLAVEEPLEIVAAGGNGAAAPISVTMRTPGADFDLVAGFLFAEGLVEDAADLVGMRYCPGTDRSAQRYNRVEVTFAPGTVGSASEWDRRSFYASSSCGVCGARSIDAVLSLGCPRVGEGPILPEETLLALPAKLREAQSLFERTGGIHAAALFDAEGSLLRVREDVGRHNAMDKLVGASLLAGELPLAQRIVLLSGRLSFELVQKAARAGVGVLAGVSAPSSLAVELAERAGITLVGFLRGASFNVYSGGARVASARAVPDSGPDPKRS
jgi:FdhD protein